MWSPRVYESVLSGCIPVIMADGMHLPFSFTGSGIDWRKFSVMIPENLIKEGGQLLKTMLWSITEEEIVQKQQMLAAIRRTMLYAKPLVMGSGGRNSARDEKENIREELQGDAFEMILRALREKARAMRYISSRHGPGHWL